MVARQLVLLGALLAHLRLQGVLALPFSGPARALQRGRILEQLVDLGVEVLVVYHPVVSFVGEVHELDVQFFGVDDEGGFGELVAPGLEDLLELREQVVHLILEYFDVLVQIDFDAVGRQQQIQLHTLALEPVGQVRCEVAQGAGVVFDGFVINWPFKLVEQTAEEQELQLVQEELLADGDQDVADRQPRQRGVLLDRTANILYKLMTFVSEILADVVAAVLLILTVGVLLVISRHYISVPNDLGISRKYKGLSSLIHSFCLIKYVVIISKAQIIIYFIQNYTQNFKPQPGYLDNLAEIEHFLIQSIALNLFLGIFDWKSIL